MGMCNRGNQCKYLHTKDPVDISPRTPGRHNQEEHHSSHYPKTPETSSERRRERTPERRHQAEYYRRHHTRTPERRRHHTPESTPGSRLHRRQLRTPERRRHRTPERRNDRLNRKKQEEKSIIDYIIISRGIAKPTATILDEERQFRVKGKNETDQNTIITTITTNTPRKKTYIEKWNFTNEEGWENSTKKWITRENSEV